MRGYFPLRPLPGSTVVTVDQTWRIFTGALWTQVGQQERFFPPRDGVNFEKSFLIYPFCGPGIILPTGDPIEQRPRQHARYVYVHSRVTFSCNPSTDGHALFARSIS